MICELSLEQIDSKNNRLTDVSIPLWPLQKKPIKVPARFETRYFVFHAILDRECDNVCVLINEGMEQFELYFEMRVEGGFLYCSPKISSKDFMRYNIGQYQFEIDIEGEISKLTSLFAEFSILTSAQMENMFSVVQRSRYFNLFVEKFSRSNVPASSTDKHRSTFTAWKTLLIISRYLRSVKGLLESEAMPFSRLREVHKIQKYSDDLQLSGEEFVWLASNPNQFEPSPNGCIAFKGIRFSPHTAKASFKEEMGQSQENEMILYYLRNMAHALFHMEENSIKIPQNIYEKAIEDLDLTYKTYERKTCVHRPRPHKVDPTKFVSTPQRKKLLQSLSEWIALINSDEYKGGDRVAIPSITDVFEYYCVTVLAECFAASGFTVEDLDVDDIEDFEQVSFVKDDFRLEVYYEPHVYKTHRSIAPVVITKSKSNFLHPDIVVAKYKANDLLGVYVLDAKFSSKEKVNQSFEKGGLGPAIFYKYGLFLHDKMKLPLKAVIAIYPTKDGHLDVTDFRDGDFHDSVVPQLQSIGIPMNASINQEVNKILFQNIFN